MEIRERMQVKIFVSKIPWGVNWRTVETWEDKGLGLSGRMRMGDYIPRNVVEICWSYDRLIW